VTYPHDGGMPALSRAEAGEQVIDAVAAAIVAVDISGDRFARVLRDTLDQLYDGRRHGRYDYQSLYKTEKTYMGTLVEINLQREFSWSDGLITDYSIEGIDVDCKFSQRIGGWELGPEMVGHVCLVVWCSDARSAWRCGLLVATEERLRAVANRDAKRRLTEQAVQEIRWLWPEHSRLEQNLLLHLERQKRERIFAATGRIRRRNPVQARVNQLFREVQGVPIRRAVLETVAHGADDPLKRARGNGGARDQLRPEGILVLGHQDNDPLVAAALGLPVPAKGEFLSVRVVEASEVTRDRPAAEIDGRYYVIAAEHDPLEPAPIVPRGVPKFDLQWRPVSKPPP
jgi:hypothetical protein